MKYLIVALLALALNACAYNHKQIDSALSDHFEVVEQDGGLILYLPSLIFELNRSELSGAGKEKLSILGGFLTSRRSEKLYLYIKGHTDDLGDEQLNYNLGLARAKTVKSELEGSGVDGSRMVAASGGEKFPRVPNTSLKNRQTNRRVEVVIINP